MLDLVAAININIDPVLFDSGGFELTWHGFFTALGIALGVWLALRLARRVGLNEDDTMSTALVAVPSGIVGARLLWVFEHTDQIGNVGDIFAITDGGISVYGAMIGGVLGGFIYVVLFKPQFPKWIALDVAAPGMILGQAVGRFGDFINGEHFARESGLPWAFRYTNPGTDGPWAQFDGATGERVGEFVRGSLGRLGEASAAVHPVAGAYEPLLDFAILGTLLFMRKKRILSGWGFVFYVVSYGVVRGTLSLLRVDEAAVVGAFSVPQLIAALTVAAAGVMAYHLLRNPQPPAADVIADRAARRDAAEASPRRGRSRQERRRRRRGIYGR